MANLRDVKQEIENTETIRMLTQALGDIATAKLKETRGSMEHSVQYFQQVSVLYRTIKSIAMRSRKPLPKKKTIPRTMVILLTSNSRLYGGLDNSLTKFFYENTIKLECDRIVVGSFGAEILRALSYPQHFENNNFKKDDPTFEELQAFAPKVFNHERILVFYSKFRTLLNQEPFISDISTSYLEDSNFKTPFHYITEPEVEKILSFFDNQISFLLFQAIFLEVNLSRLAARMTSMNQAEINAGKELKKEQKTLLKIRKQITNLRILETYSGRKIGVS